jgi:hypothetical protein
MASAFDLTRTARSLLNIEVNTIVRDNMTAEQMPSAPHALLDIAQDYADTMSNLGVDMPTYFDHGPEDPAQAPPGWALPPFGSVGAKLTVSDKTFNRLRWAADWASQSKHPAAARISAANRVLLGRIVNNSDTIKEMFKRFDERFNDQFLGKTRSDLAGVKIDPSSYSIAPDDLIDLQKIWDIGIEEIVAQTIVFVNGAITTRVQQALRGPGSETLFSIHRQSIDVSVSCWRYMLDAVKEIAGDAVRTLLSGKA